MNIFTATILVGLIMLGVPWVVVAAALVLSISMPLGIVCAVLAVLWTVIRRRMSTRSRDDGEAPFLRSLASTVSAGSTMRQAVLDSSSGLVDAHVRRLCRLGAPMADVGQAMASRMPSTGREFMVMADLSETTGAAIVQALHVASDEAEEIDRQQRELRVAVAQSKFSAVVVGVVPLGIALALLAIRGIPEPGGPFVVVPMVVGALMMAGGAAAVFAVANRAG